MKSKKLKPILLFILIYGAFLLACYGLYEVKIQWPFKYEIQKG